MQRQDPYEVLGLSKDASYAEIRKAFKKLVLQFHPDRNENENQKAEATKKFIAVHEAYLQLTENLPANNETKFLENAPLAIADHIDQYEILYDSFYQTKKDFLNKSIKEDIFDFKENFKNFAIMKHYLSYEEPYFKCLTKEEMATVLDQAKQRYKDVNNNSDDYSYLWIAQKQGCSPIYVFNTMHIMLPVMFRFKDALENMIEKSDVIFTEIAFSEISDSTRPSDYSSLDVYIANRAHQMKKTLRPLEDEDIRQYCDLYNSDELVKLVFKYRDQLKQDYQNKPDVFEEKILQLMLGKIDQHGFDESTLKRNLFWMSSILHSSSVEKNTIFVACGALHNVGKFGVPNLLRHEGYEVKPVMKNPPTLTETALKQALTPSQGLFAAKPECKLVPDDENPINKNKR